MQNNTKIVAKQSLYALIIRGLGLGISFFSTPVFIRYFNNNEILGVWFTLLSILNWFLTFDLGIGNGIRNHLVTAIANQNKLEIRKIISSGIASSLAVALVLTGIGLLILCHVNINGILNISPTVITSTSLRTTTIIVFIALMLRFSLTIITSIFYALQKSSINNFLSLCVQLFLFVYVFVFHFDSGNEALLNMAYAYLIICNLPLIIAGIFIFTNDLKEYLPTYTLVGKQTIKKIMGIGGIFFLCQIFFLVISNTNEFFISHYWNPIYSADYSFYYKITMLGSMIISLGLTPTWSMITKAYAEGNHIWLKKLYKSFKIGGVIVVVLQFLLIPFLQSIMNVWLGKGQLIVNLPTALAFSCFSSVFVYSSMLSTIVCGLAKMKLQMWCLGIGAILKITFILIIYKFSSDWAWVVWSNVIILGLYCIFEQHSLNKLFSTND